MGNKYPWTWCNWIFPVKEPEEEWQGQLHCAFLQLQCRITSSIISALQICLYFSTAGLAFEWRVVPESAVMSLEEILLLKTSCSQLVWSYLHPSSCARMNTMPREKGTNTHGLGCYQDSITQPENGVAAMHSDCWQAIELQPPISTTSTSECPRVWKSRGNAGPFLVGLKWWSLRTW